MRTRLDSTASLNPENSPASAAARRGTGAKIGAIEWVLLLVLSGAVVVASWLKWWSVPLVEAWGFATGGACVWLVVREHMANWPIGLVNNVFFFVLFFRSALYADMGLQVVYFALGVYGWWNWLHGGVGSGRLVISRTSRREAIWVLVAMVVGTWAVRELLLAVNGAAPLGDSITTVLSLGAQYLLCRKRLENWWLWILADVIYVPLYLSRGLPLIALLYAVFLVMCVLGWREWRARWESEGRTA